ncbi:unnamed protein product [Peronospora farinosa]|uniref:Uncharacterized protein n=1 Tax=Peronospora farinosa TaxID=134698 RepID=A0AAV0UZU0_9STRA|nr:unnamed protein product [Peronospora farinosa]CAI5740989.1 unnamed protein product [Peronospora farinosa]
MAEEKTLIASEPPTFEALFTHWARCVEITIGGSRVISVEQDPDTFVLGTTVWDSSKTLFKFIETIPERFQRFMSICELGAGCGGLAGIASAIVTSGVADVVLTDIGPVLPWLRRNVRENLTDKELQHVRVKQHAWGTPVTNLKAPFDCILCADVVYEKACVKPLVQSLLALSHRKTVIFLANERRAPEVRDEFMRQLDTYFQWKEVPRAELDADYLKDTIEVFEMKPKKRKVPLEMQIVVPANYSANEQEHYSFDNGAGKEVVPCDSDIWNDLLRDLSIVPADRKRC